MVRLKIMCLEYILFITTKNFLCSALYAEHCSSQLICLWWKIEIVIASNISSSASRDGADGDDDDDGYDEVCPS